MRAVPIVSGRLTLTPPTTSIHLELKVGPIPIDIHTDNKGHSTIVMTQKKPVFLSQHEPSTVLPIFGLNENDLLAGYPIQTISTGTPQLFIPLRSADSLKKATMNVTAYVAYRAQSDFFSPHLFILGGATPEGKTFARHFGTPPDTMEDPVTGSATGGMGAYLWRYGLIKVPKFVAEQGHWMMRPGKVFVEVEGSREEIEKVKIGGSAVLVLKGEMVL
ncbi:hypothetical protein BC938DRAFT_480393 [Jimgerdemannia flammicorona]|uniref:Uncharacterized protein n=1 Tax=Jimgerdemannia flammicorona TaxID=994334 RepID=A0A433QIK8_9FUNG|nr:hypothetical protein BC938DRAFT_480393 [Jimgerdemannia flammicorona]